MSLYLHEILLSIPPKHNNVTKVTRPSSLHATLKTIHAGVGGGLGTRLETWYESIAVGQYHQHTFFSGNVCSSQVMPNITLDSKPIIGIK